ncbi:MAG: P1 family peptidase [Acidimicrobiia bacterium]|nr:P1 family peptidase [Acidimicrobiia bacterium]NNF11100.1 P1 family peptidase [Acidimicrobiia bacterium]NNL69048.1 P1 family peptidase [Acidimicrobiia bacterium]
MTLTGVPGIGVGHWTDLVGRTGVTVVTLPEPNRVVVEVRGAAPGSRELALLGPGMRVEQIQAIVLTGGSAFGLAAADGVVRALEADGRGHETLRGRVPIVPAAVIYDLLAGDPRARPGPDDGAAAYHAASTDPVEMGSVGAGTGALVAGWRGAEHMRRGGLGSSLERAGDALVGALAVVNAVGDVFTLEGEPLTGGPARPGPPAGPPAPLENTTLLVVATDARIERADLLRLAVRAQDAVAACVRPGHTRYDGDVAFAVSCGEIEADLDAVGEAAFVAAGDAITVALRLAEEEG